MSLPWFFLCYLNIIKILFTLKYIVAIVLINYVLNFLDIEILPNKSFTVLFLVGINSVFASIFLTFLAKTVINMNNSKEQTSFFERSVKYLILIVYILGIVFKLNMSLGNGIE